MTTPRPAPTSEIHAFYPGAVGEEHVSKTGFTVRLYEFDEAEGVVDVPANAADHAVSLGISGAARTTCLADGERTEALTRPGHVSVDPAFVAQSWTWDAPHSVLTLYLPDALLRQIAEEADMDPDHVRVHRHPTADDSLLRHALTSLYHTECAPLDVLQAEATARLLAVHVLRRYADRPLADRPAGRLAPRALRRTLDAIEDRLSEPLTLDDLAREAALSPYHFARAFKASVGASPLRYVAERRVGRAKELLATRRYRVSEVAALVGFSDASHFSRVFRRHVGLTPSAYRRR